jgi:hypothetical protein
MTDRDARSGQPSEPNEPNEPDDREAADADAQPGASGRDGTTDDGEAAPDATGAAADATEAAADATEAAAKDTEAAIAAIAQQTRPPRPPRRTGVFVDVDDLRDHVGGLLRAILGGYEVDAFGNFSFTHEGARVFVTVGGSPIGPQVGVFSVTNVDVELTADLATFLLTTNHTLGFGAFSYDRTNRAVWLRHTLLGTTLDGPELQSAVAAVATTAARLDHPIRDRFGGGTFADAPDDVQRGVEPPQVDSDPAPPNASGYL